jgi:FtsP/CotA-like multicopper oxidase with cupredoxin domain
MKINQIRNLILAIITLFIIFEAVSWFVGDRNNSKTNSEKEKQRIFTNSKALVDEFSGAYKKDIVPNGNIVEFNMTAEESEEEIFDGVKTKVWSYNGTVPGPQLRIKLGDTLKINFTNKLPQETTVHFHGVRVPNAMDGVPGVTQDPIKPGEKFVYEFTPKDAGTFWFHPHVRTSEQMERGLFGTLVVEDKIDKKYSQDVVWVIDDWKMSEDKQVVDKFNTVMELRHDGRWGNVMTVNGKLNEVLNTKPGERIRLRLINTSNARVYKIDFGELSPKVIAVDGMYVKKVFGVNGFELAPGNRLDLDITIPKNSNNKDYIVYDKFTRNTVKLAKIKVSGTLVKTPSFDFPTNKMVPNWQGAFSEKIDKEYVLDARRKKGGSGVGMMTEPEWTINGKAYPDYDSFTLKYGEFNKIRFRNNSSRLHPMHLHGQFFKVVSRNGTLVDEQYFRDTVLVKPKEVVDIALVPLDRGIWVNHCHILEHAAAGMITAVTVE